MIRISIERFVLLLFCKQDSIQVPFLQQSTFSIQTEIRTTSTLSKQSKVIILFSGRNNSNNEVQFFFSFSLSKLSKAFKILGRAGVNVLRSGVYFLRLPHQHVFRHSNTNLKSPPTPLCLNRHQTYRDQPSKVH